MDLAFRWVTTLGLLMGFPPWARSDVRRLWRAGWMLWSDYHFQSLFLRLWMPWW